MLFKEGISLIGVKPETILGIQICDQVYRSQGHVLFVTSVCDGDHSPSSLHYMGRAFDCRIWGLSPEELTSLVTAIRNVLPKQFVVVLENDHIHVEFQPK